VMGFTEEELSEEETEVGKKVVCAREGKDEVLAQVQIAIALSVLVLLFLMVCISKGRIDPDKLKKTDESVYLETPEDDPSSSSSSPLSSSSSPSSLSPSPDPEIPRVTSDSESLHSSLFSLRSSTAISGDDEYNGEEEKEGVEPQSNDDSLGSELMALFHDFADKSDDSDNEEDEDGEVEFEDDDEDSWENLETESLNSEEDRNKFIV
jgi:hypothetical protein